MTRIMTGHKMAVGSSLAMILLLLIGSVMHASALGYDDLTEEQKAEAMQQRQMLQDMFTQLEGLTDEAKIEKVKTFTPAEQELLKAYYEHQAEMKKKEAEKNARLTPEKQQEILKDLFGRLEGKTYGEQDEIIKKFTPQEKDLYDRYNEYNKKKQEEYTEKRKKELGYCEADKIYKETKKNGDYNFLKPKFGKCQRIHIWDDAVGDDGAKALAKEMIAHADTFATLSLDTTEVEAEGAINLAEALKVCKQMLALDLDSNSAGDIGATALAKAATKHPNLNTLGLAHNDIGEEGGKAILEMLRTNYNIITMPLYGNKITQATMDEINRLLGKNREHAEAEQARLAEIEANKTKTDPASSSETQEGEGVVEIDADAEELHDEF